MTIGEDQNKDLFCNNRAAKLTQNSVCFTNSCINLLVPSSLTCKYHPKVRVAAMYCHMLAARARLGFWRDVQ